MKMLKIIIRSEKLEEVKEALTALNVTGMTVSEVRGHGRQKGHKAIYRGTDYTVTLLPKMMIDVALPDEMVDSVAEAAMRTARTGQIGDGRVFVLPIEQGYNIRTGERDTA
jgi:nitrogen regulatory protein PII